MLKFKIITIVFVYVAFSLPEITFALPVHYTATGSVTDQTGKLLPISGWLDIDDQLRDWDDAHGAGQPVDVQYISNRGGQCQFYFTGYSLIVGDHVFSGNSGHLYMEVSDSTNDDRFVDFIWYLEDSTLPWDKWIGEVLEFYSHDGSAQNHLFQYLSLPDAIKLTQLTYPFNDTILPKNPPDFSLWLSRQDPSIVPEPSTLVLVGASLFGLLACRRFRS